VYDGRRFRAPLFGRPGLAYAVRKVKAEHLALTDRELLQRFTADGNQAAFAALVSRPAQFVAFQIPKQTARCGETKGAVGQ
jgi:hypothetical protein